MLDLVIMTTISLLTTFVITIALRAEVIHNAMEEIGTCTYENYFPLFRKMMFDITTWTEKGFVEKWKDN